MILSHTHIDHMRSFDQKFKKARTLKKVISEYIFCIYPKNLFSKNIYFIFYKW